MPKYLYNCIGTHTYPIRIRHQEHPDAETYLVRIRLTKTSPFLYIIPRAYLIGDILFLTFSPMKVYGTCSVSAKKAAFYNSSSSPVKTPSKVVRIVGTNKFKAVLLTTVK